MASPLIRRACAVVFLLALVASLSVVSRGAPDAVVPADRLIQFVNQSVTLYHQTATQQQIATTPQEQVLFYDNRQIANQVVRLAFDFARSQEADLTAENVPAPAPNSAAVSSQYGSLRQMLGNLDKQYQDTLAESNSDREKLATATGAERARLQSTISELQGELALAQARRNAVQSMLEFVGGSATNNLNTSSLRAQIDALASSVPAATSGTTSAVQGRASAQALAPAIAASKPSGIWGLTSELFGLSSQRNTIESMIADTNSLLKTSDALRSPFVDRLRSLSNQGNQLAKQADTANRTALAQEHKQLDVITAQFKQISAAVMPLGKQRILLNAYKKNLTSWRNVIDESYESDMRGLGVRVGALALFLGVLFGLSELWRRAIYRYVHEPRRRYQFLLLRRFSWWFVIGLTVAVTLAGRIGSFATFAGLVGAGVALALQSVLVAVVGYFFLIGKFGIHVGDRVEVSGITGDVIDIGMVRFHLLELGPGAAPTGRLVALSNSIVFQPAAGLIKQIPGVSFAWHQVTLTVPRDADFGAIKQSLLAAVENVLGDYRERIEEVYRQIEKTGVLMTERGLRPALELRLTPSGVEAIIRYPVDLQHANDIDARVSRDLLTALESDSMLRTPEGPEIRLNTDVSAGTTE